MDPNTVSLLLHGCNLAGELESNLPNLGNRPDLVSDSCKQIAQVFNAVREQITNASSSRDEHHQVRMNIADFTQSAAMLLRHQQPLPVQQYYGLAAGESQALAETSGSGGTTDQAGGSARGKQIGPVEGSDPLGRASSSPSAQRPRRRQDDPSRRTVTVEAPRFGNTEIPPEDGFTWKKYGQKEILNSLFPRSYYRCTHQKLYQCPAKKQVQRLDSDPHTFQVTYREDHTCHMSSTAPSVAPPPATLGTVIASQEMTGRPMEPLPQGPSTAHIPTTLRQWLSMDFTLGSAGPSTATRDADPYNPLVADMADVMFNSGSSSTNSMDIIFSSIDQRDDQHHPSWEAGLDNKD